MMARTPVMLNWLVVVKGCRPGMMPSGQQAEQVGETG